MKRLVNTLFFILLAYIIPLLWRIELLTHYKIIILVLACVIVFLTQPTFDLEKAQSRQDTDKNSVFLILALSVIGIAAPIVEWAYFKSDIHSVGWMIPGISLLVLGISLRIWAIRVLGKHFTPTVEITANHTLVKSGPYALVRHPSYLGAFLAFIGSAVILEAWLGLLIAILCMLMAYGIRIRVEETTLIENFGRKYEEYQQQTKRLFPFVW